LKIKNMDILRTFNSIFKSTAETEDGDDKDGDQIEILEMRR